MHGCKKVPLFHGILATKECYRIFPVFLCLHRKKLEYFKFCLFRFSSIFFLVYGELWFFKCKLMGNSHDWAIWYAIFLLNKNQNWWVYREVFVVFDLSLTDESLCWEFYLKEDILLKILKGTLGKRFPKEKSRKPSIFNGFSIAQRFLWEIKFLAFLPPVRFCYHEKRFCQSLKFTILINLWKFLHKRCQKTISKFWKFFVRYYQSK